MTTTEEQGAFNSGWMCWECGVEVISTQTWRDAQKGYARCGIATFRPICSECVIENLTTGPDEVAHDGA